MSGALKRQLFGRAEVELKILERYELSGQYTPEKLLELYKDSILWEAEALQHPGVQPVPGGEDLLPRGAYHAGWSFGRQPWERTRRTS